ncbi:MAG: hypothetical protein IJ198_10055 [Lachnospiraceae bacterium]|nr:hypothetical protein [Lachnospiraceae bacterium]
MNAYKFGENSYPTTAALANAMAVNWSEGRDFLVRGAFRAEVGGSDKRALASAVWAEKKYNEDPSKGNLLFLKWLVKNPGVTNLYWMGRSCGDLDHVCALIKADPQSDQKEETVKLVLFMIQEQIFGDFVQTSRRKDSVVAAVRYLERCYARKESKFNRGNILPLMLAVLEEKKIFEFDGQQFRTVQELASYLQKFADISKKALSKKAAGLYQDDANFTPEFEGWLLTLGYQKALSAWKDRFQAGEAEEGSFDADLVLLEDIELREEAGGDGGDDFTVKARQFEDAFTKMLEEHPQCLESAARFKAYMSDLLPDNDLQAYLILCLYKMDIARAIEEADELTQLFPARFVSRLVSDFGVSQPLARWAASVWCVCYGDRVLKKKNSVII